MKNNKKDNRRQPVIARDLFVMNDELSEKEKWLSVVYGLLMVVLSVSFAYVFEVHIIVASILVFITSIIGKLILLRIMLAIDSYRPPRKEFDE